MSAAFRRTPVRVTGITQERDLGCILPAPTSNDRPRMRGIVVAASLSGLASVSCAVLADECTYDAHRCADAHTLQICNGNHDAIGESFHWDTQSCADSGNAYCVTPENGEPMCALEPDPNPACNPRQTTTACNDQGLVACHDGYRVQAQQCPDQCRPSPFGEACAICDDGTAVADPACSGGARGTCEGAAPADCACGYRMPDLDPCPDGTTCVVGPRDGTVSILCALSPSTDPMCDPTYQDAYCQGNTVVDCVYGYEVDRQSCGPDAHCVDDGPQAYCG